MWVYFRVLLRALKAAHRSSCCGDAASLAAPTTAQARAPTRASPPLTHHLFILKRFNTKQTASISEASRVPYLQRASVLIHLRRHQPHLARRRPARGDGNRVRATAAGQVRGRCVLRHFEARAGEASNDRAGLDGPA